VLLQEGESKYYQRSDKLLQFCKVSCAKKQEGFSCGRNGCKKICSPESNQKAVVDKQKIKRLLSFRIIKDRLLYIIGIPKRIADKELLMRNEFCGQYGTIEKIVINYQPKDVYEGQCAVYVHYANSFQVAIALKVSFDLDYN